MDILVLKKIISHIRKETKNTQGCGLFMKSKENINIRTIEDFCNCISFTYLRNDVQILISNFIFEIHKDIIINTIKNNLINQSILDIFINEYNSYHRTQYKDLEDVVNDLFKVYHSTKKLVVVRYIIRCGFLFSETQQGFSFWEEKDRLMQNSIDGILLDKKIFKN